MIVLICLDDAVPEGICCDFILCFHFVLIFPQSLFWENNHLLVTSYAENGRRLVPLCNVLYGMVGDFLNWCRQTNASGKTSACITRKVSVPIYYEASLVVQLVKNAPAMRETWLRSLGWADPLEKGKATHFSILAWRIPWAV